MKKQISGMEMAIIAVMAMVALIVVYVAGTRLSAPALPSIESNKPVISKVAEKSEALAISNMAGEGQGQYSAVVFNPATGAEIIEWNAPRVSSLSTGAAAESAAQYSAVVFNPSTGQAEAVEYFAPRVSSVASEAAPGFSAASGEGTARYSTVAVTSEGAQEVEWIAPSVSSLETAAAPETGIAGGEDMAQYNTVVVNPATGAELVEWIAQRVGSSVARQGKAQYSTVVVDSTTGQAEVVEWQAPKVR